MTYPQSDLTGLAVDDVGMMLIRAADVIRKRGHAKHTYGMEGPVCAIGAMRVALHGTPYPRCENDGTRPMQRRLAAHLKLQLVPVSRWNDAPERTADEVIDALTAAALSHAAQG